MESYQTRLCTKALRKVAFDDSTPWKPARAVGPRSPRNLCFGFRSAHTHSWNTCSSPLEGNILLEQLEGLCVCGSRNPPTENLRKQIRTENISERPVVPYLVPKEALRWQHHERILHKTPKRLFYSIIKISFLRTEFYLKEVFLAEFSFRTRLEFGVKQVME